MITKYFFNLLDIRAKNKQRKNFKYLSYNIKYKVKKIFDKFEIYIKYIFQYLFLH